jgi:hypothetical protein
VLVDPGGDKLLRTGNYSMTGGDNAWTGKLDIADNPAALVYSGGTIVNEVRSQLKSGYNAAGPKWTGNGIISSTLAAGDPTVGLGYAEAAILLGAGGGVFGGENITGNAILLKYAKFGDANLDGKVSFADFQRLEVAFGNPGFWGNGDFDYSGIIDYADFVMLFNNYGQTLGQPAAPISPGDAMSLAAFAAANVPEPAFLGIAGVGVAMLARRRRARSAWRLL